LNLRLAATDMSARPLLKTLTNLYRWGAAFFKTAPTTVQSGKEFLVIGHRGASSSEAENTLVSFQHAVQVDCVNALEVDITMTADGVLVLWHDWDPTDHISLARSQGLEPDVRFARHVKYLRPIHEITFAQFISNYGYKEKRPHGRPVGASIPRIEQFLEWVQGEPRVTYIFWDIKTPARFAWLIPKLMDQMYGLLEEYEAGFKSVFLTPHLSVMDAMEAHRSHPDYMLDVEPPPGIILDPCSFTSSKMAIQYRNAYCNTIHPKASTIGPWTTFKRVIQCDVETKERHNASHPAVPIEKIIGTTINKESEMETLIALGIDGLMSDCPGLLRKVAERMGMKCELRSGERQARAHAV
jgi:glycerophosphoryl diester phosphodiesterase